MARKDKDKTVVETRTATQVYRSGMKFQTKAWIVALIFAVVGIGMHFVLAAHLLP